MNKTIIFSCTNRPNSYTLKVSHLYATILNNNGISNQLYSFENLPKDLAFSETFGKRSNDFEVFINQYIRQHNRFVFVIPEYNGSFPGILKTWLDAIHPREWTNKKVCLVGVSNGRAGNLRGLEHITGILNYLKVHVYHNKLPISSIDKLMDEEGKFNQLEQQKVCELQLEGFFTF